MKPDLYLRNAMVVTETGCFRGGIAASGGKVSQLVLGDQSVDADEIIDIGGKIILPGIIDAHTHFSEPGREFEGYRTGSMAAAAGGVTTILDMPLNDLRPTTTRETLQAKRRLVADQSIVDYGHWGGLVNNNLGHLEEQNREGVIAFKAFMRTVADFPRVDDDLMYEGLLQIAKFDNMLGVHAENEYVTAFLREKLSAEGRIDRYAWAESRPPEQELEAITRAIFWAKAANARLYICHISLAEAVDLVKQAKHEGFRVNGETCSHYLFFDEEDYVAVGPHLRAAPPLRKKYDVEALWNGVLRGDVDVISSDHSPFPPQRYEQGMKNVWEGGGGVMGLQSMLPAVITAGVHQRGMTWELLVRLMSANPARIFGIYPQKGALLPGSDADFTIVDPEVEWQLKADDVFYRYKQSAYIGRSFKGRVTQTVVRGKTVFKDGQITAAPGHGQLVRRNVTS